MAERVAGNVDEGTLLAEEARAEELLSDYAGTRLSGLARLVRKNRAFFAASGFFVVLMLSFITANPGVFLELGVYIAVLVTLPLVMIPAVASVFVIATGEIDLSFPSTVGLSALVFAKSVASGLDPTLSLFLGLLVGCGVGLMNAFLVVYLGLSSLVATLGALFLIRGIIQVVSDGLPIDVTSLSASTFGHIFVGQIGSFPVQMFWAIGFASLALVLFNHHRFGAHICFVGDNGKAAREMGINVGWVKTRAFMFVGLGAALVGVLSVLVNRTFFPTMGEGLLLTVLASVFVGGTPTWGGVGSISGAVVGGLTVSFIESGIIGAWGLSGFYTQLFYGLVIILALAGHRLEAPRR